MYVDILKDVYSKHGTLHHACLIQGDKDVVLKPLISFFEKELSFKTKGNPDFHYMEFDTFGVSDGRTLKGRAAQKALSGRKIFVATFNAMTHEAQNALLKLFEEPTKDTHFFLITPNIDKLLLTLRSRMFLLSEESTIQEDFKKDAKLFLTSPTKDRLKHLKGMIESKDKALVTSFLDAVEAELYRATKRDKNSGRFLESLSVIEEAKSFVLDRGSSLKLLLEHVALTLPKL